MKKLLLVLALGLPAAGCTMEQLYTTAKANQQVACNRIPDAEGRGGCLQRSQPSYSDYKAEVAREEKKEQERRARDMHIY